MSPSTRRARRKAPPRPRSSKQALVLRRVRYGETSLVADVLTAEHGRVTLLARGAYRPTSRFYCVLDWFHRLELTWQDRPGESLALLDRGDIDRSRRSIPRELSRYRAGHSALELAERISRPGDSGLDLFRRTDGFLEALEDPDARPADLLARYDLGLLEELGLAPALDACARCGRRAPAPGAGPAGSAFSASAGGRLCPTCSPEVRAEGQRVGTLPAAVLERAHALACGSQAPPDAAQERALGQFLERFLVHHLESGLESRGTALPGSPPESPGSGLASAGSGADSGALPST